MFGNVSPEGFCYGCGEYDGCICGQLRMEEEDQRRHIEALGEELDDDTEEESES